MEDASVLKAVEHVEGLIDARGGFAKRRGIRRHRSVMAASESKTPAPYLSSTPGRMRPETTCGLSPVLLVSLRASFRNEFRATV